MPYYTAAFQNNQDALRYARHYTGQYNHNADNAFRATALAAAAQQLQIPQNQLHGNFQNIHALNPHHNYTMI